MSTVSYKTADTVPAGGPSPIIWADCPVLEIIRNPGKGIHIFEDFDGGGVTDNVASYKFALIGDGADIRPVTDDKSVVALDAPGTAQNAAYLVSNLICELVKNSRKKIWLEARFNLQDSNADEGVIFGLGEDGILHDDGLVDSNATIGDFDFIGFLSLTGTDIDSVYHEYGDGGTPTVIEADIVDIDGATVDNTFWKLGLKFDGLETVSFYLDGVLQAATFDLDSFDTDDRLTEVLGVVLGIKYTGNVASGDELEVDWIRFACEK